MKIENNNRITLKWWDDNPPNKSGYVYNDIDDENRNYSSLKKLGQLEDIEQDFGIDLLKLLTAKTIYFMGWYFGTGEGVLTIYEFSRGRYSFNINIGDKLLELCDLASGDRLYLDFSDYGKNNKYGGWAFTREELE